MVVVEYTIRGIRDETTTIIKTLWFGDVGQRRKRHGKANDKIKIKSGFYSGQCKSTVKNLDVQVKWAASQGGEVLGALKTQKVHIPLRGCSRGLRAAGWAQALDPFRRGSWWIM